MGVAMTGGARGVLVPGGAYVRLPWEVCVRITGVGSYPVWGGERNILFVVVDTDEGISGVGEAGLTGREPAVTGTIEHFKPLLVGQDPSRIEHLWQTLFRGGFFPARHAVSAVISAIDIALWDIKGKHLGVPVYELLGGRVRDRVVCYSHNGDHSMDTDALVESCLSTKLPHLRRPDSSVTNW
jgi:L-alanine-DL-glutamate epimerase-like enolase superfamily enzyme